MSRRRVVPRDLPDVDSVRRVRLAVYRRDGGRCRICDRSLRADAFTVDHYVPRSEAGPFEAWNLRLCCEECNTALARAAECVLLLTLQRLLPARVPLLNPGEGRRWWRLPVRPVVVLPPSAPEGALAVALRRAGLGGV